MKIGFLGLNLPLGIQKFKDSNLLLLEEKFSPKKTTPFFVEFVGDDFVHSDVIICPKDRKLDLIIEVLSRIEQRLEKEIPLQEKNIMLELKDNLEKEVFVSSIKIPPQHKELIKNLGFITLKPIVESSAEADVNWVVEKALGAAGVIFFYTAGPKEVRGWPLKQGSNIVEAAGKIHTDLARGFIRADVANIRELSNFHNMNDARQKGLVKTVGRDYIVEPGDIIEIKFSV